MSDDVVDTALGADVAGRVPGGYAMASTTNEPCGSPVGGGWGDVGRHCYGEHLEDDALGFSAEAMPYLSALSIAACVSTDTFGSAGGVW